MMVNGGISIRRINTDEAIIAQKRAENKPTIDIEAQEKHTTLHHDLMNIEFYWHEISHPANKKASM